MYRKQKPGGWALFFSLLLAGIFSGCVALPSVEEEINMPLWMSDSEGDPLAYKGIGSAAGNDETAIMGAKKAARDNMAALIAEDESLRLAESLQKKGQHVQAETFYENVKEALLPLIPNIEPAGTWISPEKESWVFLRFNRQEWKRLRSDDRRVSVPVPGGLADFSGMNVSLLGILNEMSLPLQLIPGGSHTPFLLQMDWFITDESPSSVRISASLAFEQYGVTLDKRQYGPVLVTGKNNADAREKGAIIILELLQKDQEFSEMIREWVSL